MEKSLKACPFCGKSGRLRYDEIDHHYTVGCLDFCVSTYGYSKEAEAIKAWNTRPTELGVKCTDEKAQEISKELNTQLFPEEIDAILAHFSRPQVSEEKMYEIMAKVAEDECGTMSEMGAYITRKQSKAICEALRKNELS